MLKSVNIPTLKNIFDNTYIILTLNNIIVNKIYFNLIHILINIRQCKTKLTFFRLV